MRITPLLLLPILLAACEGGPPWGGEDEAPAAEGRDEFGPTAAYDRRLIFLGPGSDLPTAAVFDFAVLSDSTTLRRGIRARLLDGPEWVPLMDAGWEMERMREPWRLIPYGGLSLIVGSSGELDALLFQGEDTSLRLEPGATIAEYSPDAGTQLVLRQGRLTLGGEPLPGVMLDAQLGRAVNPATLPPAFGDSADADTADGAAADRDDSEDAEDGDDAAGADSLSVDPAPTARPGASAFLVDNTGFYVAFETSAEGEIAWIHAAGRDDIRRGGRLEAFEWEPFEGTGARVPTAWRIVAPGGALAGELRAEAADRAVIGDGPDVAAIGYVVVTGWIEDRAVRRNVYGLVRHVR